MWGVEVKYKVGDLLLIKDIRPPVRPRPRLHHRPRLHPRLRLLLHLHLHNTIGIITEIEKHTDIFESGSTEDDNGYVWYSQVDGREYYFYQDEVECGVLE
jgi:hypothetical protein